MTIVNYLRANASEDANGLIPVRELRRRFESATGKRAARLTTTIELTRAGFNIAPNAQGCLMVVGWSWTRVRPTRAVIIAGVAKRVPA